MNRRDFLRRLAGAPLVPLVAGLGVVAGAGATAWHVDMRPADVGQWQFYPGVAERLTWVDGHTATLILKDEVI